MRLAVGHKKKRDPRRRRGGEEEPKLSARKQLLLDGLKPPPLVKRRRAPPKKAKAKASKKPKTPAIEGAPKAKALVPYEKAELKVVHAEVVKRPPGQPSPCEIVLRQCPAALDEGAILRHYGGVGEGAIAKIELPRFGHTGTGSCTGLITFVNAQLAKKAAALPPPEVEGRPVLSQLNVSIRSRQKDPRFARLRPPTRQIVLLGCPRELTLAHVRQHYGTILGDDAAVSQVVWRVGHDGEYDGTAYVAFSSQAYARRAADVEPPTCPETGVRVEQALATGLYETSSEIVLERCPRNMTELEVRQHYSSLGPGAIIRVVLPKFAKSSGTSSNPKGLVRFRSPEVAAKALSLGAVRAPKGKYSKRVKIHRRAKIISLK
eukprot:RCo031031